MTDISGPLPSFDIGKVFSHTFQAFWASFFPLLIILGFVTAATSIIPVAVGGTGALVGSSTASVGVQFTLFVLTMILFVVAFSAAVLLINEKGHGRSISVFQAFGDGLSNVGPLLIFSIVFYVVLSVMTVLVIIPGLWIAAVWSVTVPVIMQERLGFGALGRSARLTKGYRWPIVGVLLLVGLIAIIIFSLSISVVYVLMGVTFASLIAGETANAAGPSGAVVLLVIIIQTLSNGVFYGLLAAVVSAIFVRLTDIKEGGENQEVAEVFN